ncbi:hypothetical protein GA0115240_123635 [Streptomyces sp. DvalAA-14]|uniref:hypothetical protein n=1 Tax=unclassified Streptomyces TaxID=2593676 RepID=UPI00081B276A|nr:MULTISPECIES: hypothetical protein [unclassified Streptomyces]MYS20825.1 hypothetical protein [Streptomyces sp. SID4948]SCD78033.1 hypothetical protein GA0115240_123635 [Streptomyces sp. DvalAA-14]
MEFFIAPDDEAAAQVKGFGTRGAFEAVPGGIYDPSDAVVEWESLFTGTSPQVLMQAGEPRIITEITNDGCYVFVVSDRVMALLATADEASLAGVAQGWAQLRQGDGEDIHEEEAFAHLGALADLARSAVGQGARLYCSVT